MTIHPIPALPWNKVGTDLFELDGCNYLVIVDYYSNYIEVMPLQQDTRSTTVIKQLKTNIARYGIMETLISDNGPQFTSKEFKNFTAEYKINHITSSPTHQQSNGLAEEAVKQMKDLMKKCKQSGQDFFLALLDVRNTPRDDIVGSPMQRLHGRRAQTSLPISDTLLKPSVIPPDKVHDKMMEYRRRQKFYYDKGSKPLKPINPQEAVRVWTPQGWKPAEYIAEHDLPNSHVIRAGSQGLTYRRNRRHLMPTSEEPHVITTPEPPIHLRPRMMPSTPSVQLRPKPVSTTQNPTTPIRRPPPPPDNKTRTPQRSPPPMNLPSSPIRSPPIVRSPPRTKPPEPQTSTRPVRQRRAPTWLKDYVN